MKRKVLWVEDNAFSDLTALAGALYVTGDYNLVVASDASDGFRYLMQKEFDAVIMDIRIVRWTTACSSDSRPAATLTSRACTTAVRGPGLPRGWASPCSNAP